MTDKKIFVLPIGIGIAFIAVLGGIYFLNTQSSDTQLPPPPVDESPTAEAPPPSPEVSNTKVPPLPEGYQNFKNNNPQMPADLRNNLTGKFHEALDLIEKEPDNSQLWIDLGGIKYAFNDFAGAEVAWKYAIEINPLADVARMNLAALYQYKVPNYPEAERMLRQVIENRPPNVLSAYSELFDLYRYRYSAKSHLAVGVMQEAYREFPDTHAILKTIAWHYLEIGDEANARKYFEDFLKKVPDDASAREELDRLTNQ